MKVWLKNMAGIHCSELELLMIGHPRRELLTHVTVKSVQACSVLGLVAAGPLYALYNGKRSSAEIRDSALMGGRYGFCAGMMLGPISVAARMSTLNDVEVYDRCYRLRHNENVTRVDRMSLLGTAIGGGVAAFQGGDVADGAIVGMAGGIFLAAAYNVIKTGKIKIDTSGM